MPQWVTEQVLVQALITVGVIAAAVVPAWFALRGKLAEIGKDAKEAREQVKNTHTTNLREEQDDRHAEIIDTLKEAVRDIRGLRDDHQATRQDIGQLHGAVRSVRADVQGLREADEQGRDALHQAVSERDREINRIRAEIPNIIRRELGNSDGEGGAR